MPAPSLLSEFDAEEVAALESWLSSHLSQGSGPRHNEQMFQQRGKASNSYARRNAAKILGSVTQEVAHVKDTPAVASTKERHAATVSNNRMKSHYFEQWSRNRMRMGGIRIMAGAGIPMGMGLWGAVLSGNPVLMGISLAAGLAMQQVENVYGHIQSQREALIESLGGRSSLPNPFLALSRRQLEGEQQAFGGLGLNRGLFDHYQGYRAGISGVKTWMKTLTTSLSFSEANKMAKREAWGMVQWESPAEAKLNKIERERFEYFLQRGGTNYGGYGKIPEVAGG